MLTQDQYQTILIEKSASGVAIATLNRPEKLNAINARMHTELGTLTLDADADPDVKVLLVAGAGRAFCAGETSAVRGTLRPPAAARRCAKRASSLTICWIARSPSSARSKGMPWDSGRTLPCCAMWS